ncbi:MAG: type 2 isopentenyl-diphosphate Delta-isomerase [Proteobacteria bacterium]|nr:MAG: type 2 isopentenyl-diphosphate Delta-isomerase [Pseudomonadota bacterium]
MSGIGARKDAHLDICLEHPVESGAPSGLGRLTLEYDALPEVDLEAIDLTTTFLGKTLRAPLIVGAMTGGTERASEINARLARAAARAGVGMALGSQRAMIVESSLTTSFAVRQAAPELPLLIGNIGAVQLAYGVTREQIERAVAAVEADGLSVHLNPLQEAIQPEGDTRFSGLRVRLQRLAAELPFPVLVKEVGAGISARTAAKLATLPLAGVEVAGVGGTSWAKVESYRAPAKSVQAAVGRRLAGFGVPTAEAIRACRAALPPQMAIVASGGIRAGLDVALSLALGATIAALARPLLEAAQESEDAAYRALELLIHELRVVCFCTGCASLADLRKVRVLDASTGRPVRSSARSSHASDSSPNATTLER